MFNIHMPQLYGEGIESAFRRLREEIEKISSPAGLKAYSLLGMFNVHMPPQYGEGIDSAFRQLREEINKGSSSAGVKPSQLPATNEEGASDSQSPGSTSEISFERVVFEAVKIPRRETIVIRVN
jgi:ribosomal protein S21